MEIRKWIVRWYALYSKTLEKYPVATQMSTSAALWFAGDVAAQRFEAYGNERKSIIQKSNTCLESDNNVKNDRQCLVTTEGEKEVRFKCDPYRTAVQTFYGSVLWAPVAHYWYEALDRFAYRVAPLSQGRRLGTKLALEIVALHPVGLLGFFTAVGYMNGETSNEILSQLQRDFIPTLTLEIALWTPLDLANFIFVPVRHQLLVVNCGCFIESAFLSIIKANGITLPGDSH